MNVYIVSLKYAPGLTREFSLLGELFAGAGYQVRYLLSAGYAGLVDEAASVYLAKSTGMKQVIIDTLLYPFGGRAKVRRQFKATPPDVILIYNPHPLNADLLFLAAQAQPSGKRILYIHEPGKANVASYGIKGRVVYGYLEHALANALEQCTDVIVPSEYAGEIFNDRYGDFKGDVHYCPLLGPDKPGMKQQRQFFSMVGRFNYTKRLDSFITLINYCAAEKEGFQFAVATASDIKTDLQLLSDNAVCSLQVINPARLDDAAISEVMTASRAVFCLHENVVQSGVIPMAFMNSTPVIVRNDPGFAQHVSHCYNGYILPYDFTPADMVAAMRFVCEKQEMLCENARATYENTYAPNNWLEYYNWLTNKN